MSVAEKFFRVLVCGGRDYADRDALYAALTVVANEFGPLEIISGGATGADHMAFCWAGAMGYPAKTFMADWKTHGRRAGPIRNQEMIDRGKPDLVVAFPGGRGTADMISRARAAGIQVCRP